MGPATGSSSNLDCHLLNIFFKSEWKGNDFKRLTITHWSQFSSWYLVYCVSGVDGLTQLIIMQCKDADWGSAQKCGVVKCCWILHVSQRNQVGSILVLLACIFLVMKFTQDPFSTVFESEEEIHQSLDGLFRIKEIRIRICD